MAEAFRVFLQRVTRNSTPLTGLVTASIGLLIIFNIVSFSDIQVGAILTFVGALVLFLSSYITPISDPRLPIGTVVNATDTSSPTGVVVSNEELSRMKAGSLDPQLPPQQPIT